MVTHDRIKTYVARRLRVLGFDLTAVLGLSLMMVVVAIIPSISETIIRSIIGFVFVLFVPGYSVTSALFPRSSGTRRSDEESAVMSRYRGRIDGTERVVVSLGLSVAVVSIVGLVLSGTPWGIAPIPLMLSINTIVLGAITVAVHRRQGLPPAERFRVPYGNWIRLLKQRTAPPTTRSEAILTSIFALTVVVAAISVGYAAFVPRGDETYTRLYLLTESDGELTADGYPSNFTVGESRPVIVGIDNKENERMSYTLVVRSQRVRTDGNSTSVVESETLRTAETALEPNESDRLRISLSPTTVGRQVRIQFLLYRGEPPTDPSGRTAYREVHLWISVTDS
jgi:uncharacterized membrane protein